jgi:hypothetical protein
MRSYFRQPWQRESITARWQRHERSHLLPYHWRMSWSLCWRFSRRAAAKNKWYEQFFCPDSLPWCKFTSTGTYMCMFLYSKLYLRVLRIFWSRLRLLRLRVTTVVLRTFLRHCNTRSLLLTLPSSIALRTIIFNAILSIKDPPWFTVLPLLPLFSLESI